MGCSSLLNKWPMVKILLMLSLKWVHNNLVIVFVITLWLVVVNLYDHVLDSFFFCISKPCSAALRHFLYLIYNYSNSTFVLSSIGIEFPFFICEDNEHNPPRQLSKFSHGYRLLPKPMSKSKHVQMITWLSVQ